jgi:hypothetical protein
MAELKLGKLPDRSPVKLAILITPDLNQRLAEYARLYGETYGREEPVAELVPAMLGAFLDSDKEFVRRTR